MTNDGFGNAGGGGDPPGKDLLCLALALLAAVLGTPYLFHVIGPLIRNLVYEAYDSELLAQTMYYASFILSGTVIYAACRMAIWYAVAAATAFAALRFGGALLGAG